MKAEITATSVRLVIDLTQRELELLHAMVSHTSGFEAEKLARIEESAAEYTEIMHALARASATQIRQVVSSLEERLCPTVLIKEIQQRSD